MGEYKFVKYDFENPSFFEVFLDETLKILVGELLFYNSFIKTFELKGHERVLDFGCGSGFGSRCIAKKLTDRGSLTCVDISNFWTSKAKKRLRHYSNIEFKVGNIEEMDIPDSSFDVISIIHVIHDIEPQKRQGVVNALSNKLKDSGTLFLWEPIRTSHGMPAQEIKELMSKAGLREVVNKQSKSTYKGEFKKAIS